MYKSVTAFFIALTITSFDVFAFAAESPVNLNHSSTGQKKVAMDNKKKGSTETTLDYTLHVENPGDTPLTDLSLSLVSRPPLVSKRTVVRVDYLGPHQSTDIKLKVVTRMVLDPDTLSRKPLLWAGECRGAQGKLIEFPAKSRPGGTK